ncbi:MAG: ABC transporter ATP-binding protein [Candidatus Thorarchaeota archaeon]|nr:ABC transporter ATP-binding protein [Candidatus Thorarchaeota archaeon]
MHSQAYVIETDNLTKRYGDVLALNQLNLKVPKNSIFAFLGPNGAGKTTTIKLLLGLTHPTAGGANVLGRSVIGDNDEVRRRIGYLAQHPRFYKELSARETMRFAARLFFKGPEDKIEERIEHLLRIVDLEDKADRPIEGFSGGEMQRLGIAQAQINFPELLILDEPAAGLDPEGREKVLKIMESLRSESTIFYSTHILDDVQRVSDRVAILNKGNLIAQAPIEELLAGSEGMAYILVLEGDTQEAYKKLSAEPWVTGISEREERNRTHWVVDVNDDSMARKQLLRTVLADEEVDVLDFGLKQYELEEIFMKLVEDHSNDC